MSDGEPDRLALLGKHFLLAHLDRGKLERLLRFARVEAVPCDAFLFRKGDPARGLIAILDGKVKIAASDEGKESTFNILGPGEIFGEIALIDGDARTADAVAIEDSRVLVIDRRDFRAWLERDPELCVHLMVLLCRRIRHIGGLLEDAAFLQVGERLAKKLLRLADEFGRPTEGGVRIGVKLSQTELGNLVGATRRSVNAELGDWREAGLVAVENGYIVLRDRDGLERIATGERNDG